MNFISFQNWLTENVFADTYWQNGKSKLTLKDVLEYLDKTDVKPTYVDTKKLKSILIKAERDENRVQKANLHYPLIVTQSKGKFISILDGNHRLAKALKNNVDKIKVRILKLDDAPKEYKSIFESTVNERAAEKLEYACIMLGAKIPDWRSKISIVKEEDLYKEGTDYGRETKPHVTIVYGLHDEINSNDICSYVEKLWPVKVEISHIGVFETPDYDVVKFDVPAVEQLKAYRKFFMRWPNTQTYKEYCPHITIAYVKKGEGKKYEQDITPFTVVFNTAIYSNPNENQRIFDLGDQLNSRYE